MKMSIVSACAMLLLCSAVQAEGWGSLEGQFILKGDIPDVPPVVEKGDTTKKDAEVCAAKEIPNEGKMFDPKTKGIANVVIYMRKAPAVHPDLEKPKEEKVVFDQKNCRFFPHVLIVRTDQKVVCKSSDAVAHNVHTNPFGNTAANFIVQPNDEEGQDVAMPVPESLPVKIVCDIHPWMEAYWVVTNNPYTAVTDKEGKFKIDYLPEGDLEFRVWNEATGYIDRKFKVTVKAGETTTVEPVEVDVKEFE